MRVSAWVYLVRVIIHALAKRHDYIPPPRQLILLSLLYVLYLSLAKVVVASFLSGERKDHNPQIYSM